MKIEKHSKRKTQSIHFEINQEKQDEEWEKLHNPPMIIEKNESMSVDFVEKKIFAFSQRKSAWEGSVVLFLFFYIYSQCTMRKENCLRNKKIQAVFLMQIKISRDDFL